MTLPARIKSSALLLLGIWALTRKWSTRPAMKPVWAHALRLATLALVVLLVHREVHSLLYAQVRYHVDRPEFSAAGAPPGSVGRQAAEDVNGALSEVRGRALDEDFVEGVGRRLETCPWVKEVDRVRRVYPNELSIDVALREPFLTVRHGGVFYRVDASGVRLPGEARTAPANLCWPVVTGIVAAPPPAGRPWATNDLADAFEIVKVIEASPMLQRLRIEEMDLSNLDGRIHPGGCEIVLRLRGGCEIAWGSAPSNRKIWEAGVEEKLANLKRVLDSRPGLEAVQQIRIYEPGQASVVTGDGAQGRR